jgi:hypothetical protein
MKCFKLFLRKIDVFGVPYSFKHKKNEKYSTSLGGFVLILFTVVVFVIGIYCKNIFEGGYHLVLFIILFYSFLQ